MKIITALEIEQIFSKWKLPLTFDSVEQAQFSHTTEVDDNSAALIAFPTPVANDGLNILNLRKLLGVDPLHPPSFFDHPWYLTEEFAAQDCTPGWHFIQMDVQQGTVEKPYNYHHSLMLQNLVIPTAVEVVLMLFIHFELTGERLLWKKHTWCSNSASLGRIVTVGAFGRNGLFVSGHPPDFASRGLGICGKLQL